MVQWKSDFTRKPRALALCSGRPLLRMHAKRSGLWDSTWWFQEFLSWIQTVVDGFSKFVPFDTSQEVLYMRENIQWICRCFMKCEIVLIKYISTSKHVWILRVWQRKRLNQYAEIGVVGVVLWPSRRSESAILQMPGEQLWWLGAVQRQQMVHSPSWCLAAQFSLGFLLALETFNSWWLLYDDWFLHILLDKQLTLCVLCALWSRTLGNHVEPIEPRGFLKKKPDVRKIDEKRSRLERNFARAW